MKHLIFCMVVGCVSPSNAEQIFTDTFDMNSNYTQYLYETKNARVFQESGYPVKYWGPAKENIEAEVTYRYELDFDIKGAFLTANIHDNNDGYTIIEASTDGVLWSTVASGNIQEQINPFNLHDILSDSNVMYIRCRMKSSYVKDIINMSGSQFLRTTDNPNLQQPFVYSFYATSVPEPATLGLAIIGLTTLLVMRKGKYHG